MPSPSPTWHPYMTWHPYNMASFTWHPSVFTPKNHDPTPKPHRMGTQFLIHNSFIWFPAPLHPATDSEKKPLPRFPSSTFTSTYTRPFQKPHKHLRICIDNRHHDGILTDAGLRCSLYQF